MDKTQTGVALLRFITGGVITPEETRSIFYEFLQVLEELTTLRQQLADSQKDAARIEEAVYDAIRHYERFGAVCEFEGNDMIYASMLTELAEIMQKDQSNEA